MGCISNSTADRRPDYARVMAAGCRRRQALRGMRRPIARRAMIASSDPRPTNALARHIPCFRMRDAFLDQDDGRSRGRRRVCDLGTPHAVRLRLLAIRYATGCRKIVNAGPHMPRDRAQSPRLREIIAGPTSWPARWEARAVPDPRTRMADSRRPARLGTRAGECSIAVARRGS